MKVYKNSRAKEYLIYAGLCLCALAFPFFRVGGWALDTHEFPWEYVFRLWSDTLPFLILLGIHIVFLLPVLLKKNRVGLYVILTMLCLVLFFFVQQYRHEHIIHPRHEHIIHPRHEQFAPPPRDAFSHEQSAPLLPHPRSNGPVIIDIIVAILLLGCSLSAKLVFKHNEDVRKVEALERSRNRQELAQLKAQVSPHFFMNSLNNIHGMVEMDPPRAQEMILELSGMMRYVLYECAAPQIPLSQELDFVTNYISLMRGRYFRDKVDIRCELPDRNEASLISIPPLIFIVFLENAFKHGVSYISHSFVDVCLKIESGKICFRCENSLRDKGEKERVGGVGLVNIRKRLDILYAKDYDLKIRKDDHKFCVTLTLPIRDEN